MKIVKFEQPSCMPCKMLDGFLKHMGFTVDEKVDIVVDADGLAKAQELGIKSTPALVLYDDNGVVVDMAVGMKQDKIIEMFGKR